MSRPRILLTHTPDMRANYYGERALAGLQALGDVALHDGETPLDSAGMARLADGCSVIVTDRNTPAPADLFAQLPDTVIALLRCAVDIRTIDVDAASRAGVLITRASPGFVPAVAEMAFGQMIDLARGVSRAVIDYRGGRVPEARKGVQLSGATLGLVGYGVIARHVAKIAHAFGMTVIVHDPYVRDADPLVRMTTLDEVVAKADFLLPLAVATPETEDLIGETVLRAMKPSAFLVNLSRGNLVDEAALVRALNEKWIAGAAMDVGRAADQMPSLDLAARDDVVATPHIGGLTPQAIEHQAMETVAQTGDILAGRMPAGAVNAAAALRFVRRNT